MREYLAERLLATVMNWLPERVAEERPLLQHLAKYKYDEYQQFATGMHFVERLAVWMENFTDVEEREQAYRFVRSRLLFISEAEMRALVSSAYPDCIRPVLVRRTAGELSLPYYKIAAITSSVEFRAMERRALFLGLSDGARIDLLRRTAGLSNEQVHSSYHLSEDKCQDIVSELRTELGQADALFTSLFLIDDFSGSGYSLVGDETSKGRIVRCLEHLMQLNKKHTFLDTSQPICLVLYLATEQASEALRSLRVQLKKRGLPELCTVPAYVLPSSVKISATSQPDFDALLIKYYDPSVMNKHLRKGGSDVIHGFSNCALPLVLTHNTPNNSVHLLWAETTKVSGLFPRVTRHRDET